MSARKTTRRPNARPLRRPASWIKGALIACDMLGEAEDASDCETTLSYPHLRRHAPQRDIVSAHIAKLTSPAIHRGFAAMLSHALQALMEGDVPVVGWLQCLAEQPPRQAHREWQRILKKDAKARAANASSAAAAAAAATVVPRQAQPADLNALDDASIKLLHVRSVLDLLHEAVCHGGSILIEQLDHQSWGGLVHSMLIEVDEARALIDDSPRAKIEVAQS